MTVLCQSCAHSKTQYDLIGDYTLFYCNKLKEEMEAPVFICDKYLRGCPKCDGVMLKHISGTRLTCDNCGYFIDDEV